MERFDFEDRFLLYETGNGGARVQGVVERFFDAYSCLLPEDKDALIFIKPNLNNDQNALMGNSTDLRIIVAVLEFLTKLGYRHIVLGDGCNVGINRKGINVFSRLKLDRLAKIYNIDLLDLNSAESMDVELAGGHRARVARICSDAELFISLPKIKTHAEAGMSICLKNLVGCLAGGLEKKKMHRSLVDNILRVNAVVTPHLYIVDGLVAMEGNGPGDGVPRKIGLMVAGRDPYLIDAFCARVTGYETKEVPCLALAVERGLITEKDIAALTRQEILTHLEKAPPRKLLTRVLGHNLFMGLRDMLRSIIDSHAVNRLLYRSGIIQDCYDTEEMNITGMRVDRNRCTDCGDCLDYCPRRLEINRDDFSYDGDNCIRCLYCYWVCKENAIVVEGDMGYMDFHLTRSLENLRKTL